MHVGLSLHSRLAMAFFPRVTERKFVFAALKDVPLLVVAGILKTVVLMLAEVVAIVFIVASWLVSL